MYDAQGSGEVMRTETFLSFRTKSKPVSDLVPVCAHLPLNARLIFHCYRSRTNASIYLQNGRSLVLPVCGETADNRDKVLNYRERWSTSTSRDLSFW